MKKFKRMIALVTVAMFILSFSAPMAFAKTQDDAVDRLNALDIVNGYNDGTFKLDQEITRAEFAVIAVKLLGLNDAVAAANGSTQFSDVAADHWASGFINLATSNKVIIGYPDGTFKPEKNVSYAEAITMLVNVLGYGVTVKGEWPTGHIGKAAQIGLLDDVAFADYNNTALRGTVFLAADNALDIEVLNEQYSQEQTADGDKTIHYTKGDPLLKERLNITELKDKLVDAVSVAHNAITNKKVGLSTDTLSTVDVENWLDFYGLNVNAYKNKDGKIIDIKADEDEVFTDKVKAITSTKITFYGEGTKTKAASVAVYEDFAAGSLAVGDYVTVVLDSGKVSKVIVRNYTAFGLVDRVENDTIYFESDPAATDIELEDLDMDYVQIFKNGKVATLDDIEAGDLVAYANSGDAWLIEATDKVVEGKLDTVAATAGGTFKLTVDGEAVYSAPGLEYSTDNGDSYSSSATLADFNDDVVGEDVKVLLNPNGEAALVIAGEQAANNTAKVLVRNITKKSDVAGNTNSETMYIKVTKVDGTDAVYEIDNDDYAVTGAAGADTAYLDLDKGTDSANTNAAANGDGVTTNDDQDVAPLDFAKVTFDDNGLVTKVEALSALTLDANGIDKNNDLMYSTAAYVVSDDTAVIQAKELGTGYVKETTKISWATVENNETALETTHAANVQFLVDGKEIVMVYINVPSETTPLTSSKKYGVTVGGQYGIGGGDYAIKIMVDGTTEAYTLGDSVNTFNYANGPVVFKMNSDGTKIESVDAVKDDVNLVKVNAFTVADIKTVGNTYILVDGSGTEYIIKKDAVEYFDNTGSAIETATGISKGKVVELYDFLDKDGDVASALTGDNAVDSIYDYVVIVD